MADGKNYAVVMNLPNGHTLQNGKYRLTHVVGQGGFGITYKGVWFTEVKGSLGTVKTEVPIAIKEYFFKDYCYRDQDSYAVKVHSETGKNLFDKFKEKLIKEARILSDVHHPNIVNVLEVFEENNTAYIAMEYISGLSLKEMMEREGTLIEDKVLKYTHQIGDALQFVHDNNIIHLDVKPSNILIDRRDNARLIDFGVSKRYDMAEEHETSTTMLTLSKGFASIEQYDNEGTLSFSPYPDIYSLGATMYNLLTGKIPTESILRATRPLANPAELNPSISEKTENAILKAMEIVAANRFASVREMLDSLDKPIEEEVKEIIDNRQRAISNGGDTTLLYQSTNKKLPIDPLEEQTVLNVQDEEVLPPKRKKKRIYITISFIALAIVASAITIVYYSNKQPVITNPVVNVPVTPNNDKPSNPIIDDGNEVKQEQNPSEEEIKTDSNISQPVETNATPTVTNNEKPKNELNRNDDTVVSNEPIVSVIQPSAEELEATYNDLIASGNEKMSLSDYAGAKTDFRKAYDIFPKDELLNHIIEADNLEKEKIITERKAQYELMMTLGNLTVVNKISTGLFGAIDDSGIEQIPCIYILSDNVKDGRAFLREDNLFDIYNNEGKLVSKGVVL